MLYYNTSQNLRNRNAVAHQHPHPVVISPSILRMSAWQRLAMAAAMIVVIWAAVFWAMM
jgi:hypothetical protein